MAFTQAEVMCREIFKNGGGGIGKEEDYTEKTDCETLWGLSRVSSIGF